MWNLKGMSKLLQQQIDKENYKIHREHLKSIAPAMKILPPVEPLFLKERNVHDINTKHSAKQWQRKVLQHYKRIQRIKPSKDVLHLVKKRKTIDKIIPDPQQLKELEDQNKKICDILSNIPPSYSTKNMKEAFEKHKKRVEQISHNARRMPTSSLKRLKRCKSAGGTVREVNAAEQNQVQQMTENIATSRSIQRPQSSLASKKRSIDLRSTEENTNTVRSSKLR